MGMISWTDKQAEAIRLRDKNIIVSAAAGSGKTAVLVERIKQLIIKDRVAVSEMLIVTFTNAAAGEMREKIARAINREISENPQGSQFLRSQLSGIYKANIQTFHAFALEVIRRYFHMTDIDPSFKICDDAQKKILQEEAISELFERLFDEGNADFLAFLNKYASAKNENSVRDMVSNLHGKVQALPDPLGWLAKSVGCLNDQNDDLYLSPLLPFIIQDIKESLSNAMGAFQCTYDFLADHGVYSVAEKCQADLEKVRDILEMLERNRLEEALEWIKSFKGETFRVSKDEKEAYQEIQKTSDALRRKGKDLIRQIGGRYFARNFKDEMNDIRGTYADAVFLMTMVQSFDALYKMRKREKNLLDFNDIEHEALSILKDQKVADEYRSKFKYIFIDEYQDSNLLQEALVDRIKRENNVFMVGDVKQSIYKFRLAEPEIFLTKYDVFRKNTSGNDAKIDLNTNFRCKGEIIKTVNSICSGIMAYDDDSALHQGVCYQGELDYPVELHFVEAGKKQEEDFATEADQEINDLNNAELEANIAADLIQKTVGQKIYDQGKDGEDAIREIGLRDIVILMRSTKNYAEQYYRVLTDRGISTYIDDSDGFFNTLEIELFLNLLRVIDNRRQDIPLISVLHSVIIGFTIDELAQVRISCKGTPYYDALVKYSESGEDETLQSKCREVFEKLAFWKQCARTMPLDELLWKLIWETGYYVYAGALPGGLQRQANLKALVDKALQYREMQTDGLYGFIQYIEVLKEKEIPTGQVSLVSESDHVVRIMTVHKSKGLEFPVVMVAGLGRKFRKAADKDGVSMHKDIGIGLRYVEPENRLYRKTLMQAAIETKIRLENMEEETRILYVALTRAKDKLILLGIVKDAVKSLEQYRVLDPGNMQLTLCYLDMIAPTFLKKHFKYEVHDRSDISLSLKTDHWHGMKIRTLLTQNEPAPVSDQIREEVRRRLSYEYENKKALKIKSKYSVSELNFANRKKPYEMPFAVPLFAQGKKRFTGTEIGTLMHTVMECLDFGEAIKALDEGREAGKNYLAAFVSGLEEKEILTFEQAGAVNLSKIEAFLCSDIGRRAAKAKKIFKEETFNIIREIDGVEAIVQGIIDCYFEEDGEYVLVDYKTNYVARGDESIQEIKEIYREQVMIYKDALETIRNIPVKESYLYLFGIDEAIRI